MTGDDNESAATRGNMLVNLQHGVSRSSLLAERLATDAIVGSEALALLGRLRAIRTELNSLSTPKIDPRRVHNDPFWNEPPHPFQRGAAG